MNEDMIKLKRTIIRFRRALIQIEKMHEKQTESETYKIASKALNQRKK